MDRLRSLLLYGVAYAAATVAPFALLFAVLPWLFPVYVGGLALVTLWYAFSILGVDVLAPGPVAPRRGPTSHPTNAGPPAPERKVRATAYVVGVAAFAAVAFVGLALLG
ncbi:MAG: hypothetical protein ABEJ04_03480 [Halobacteriaceae archaeon]